LFTEKSSEFSWVIIIIIHDEINNSNVNPFEINPHPYIGYYVYSNEFDIIQFLFSCHVERPTPDVGLHKFSPIKSFDSVPR
jgi:hypothetical protein